MNGARCFAALSVLVLSGVVSGCDDDGEASGQVCSGTPGGITDLSAEPRYSATYLHRWTTAECLVRLDVLMTRTGGCGPEDMLMGDPLGASSESGTFRIYVRGDTVSLGGGAAGYVADTSLPATASDTGFHQGARELWMVPQDDSFVFVRYADDGHVETWPRDTRPVGCI
jgi:hypothetical protein